MLNRPVRSPPPSPVKPPERCPHCGSPKIATKGSRLKKLETVRLYHCRACDRGFTPGPLALRNKTYPLHEILEALTAYNQGHSLEDAARRLSSRHGHAINPATISRWLSAHPGLTTYRRLRPQGRRLFSPAQVMRIVKLYHSQVYEFGCHRAKLVFLREGTLDDRRAGDTKFAPLADFLESVPRACPHDLFRRDDGARASKLPRDFLALDRLIVLEKQNTATDTAALIIPGVGSNRDRHPKLQRFMLANDSVTIAVEVPIWLTENDIAALEEKYCVTIVPKEPVDPANPEAGHKPRHITGHIDFLQVRNGAIHILDYKPDARTNKPMAQLTIYALALTRLVPGLRLFDIKCAWFNETCYNEFFPRLLLPRPVKASFGSQPRTLKRATSTRRLGIQSSPPAKAG
jgi:transposase-like protein